MVIYTYKGTGNRPNAYATTTGQRRADLMNDQQLHDLRVDQFLGLLADFQERLSTLQTWADDHCDISPDDVDDTTCMYLREALFSLGAAERQKERMADYVANDQHAYDRPYEEAIQDALDGYEEAIADSNRDYVRNLPYRDAA